jgi:hypothetical protein
MQYLNHMWQSQNHATSRYGALARSCWPRLLAVYTYISDGRAQGHAWPLRAIPRRDLLPTDIKAGQTHGMDFHTFGCPIYALDSRLQQGNKIPKWQARSRKAFNLSRSPRHAQTVPIVLNIHIGLCSLQYHVVFDDYFTTTTQSTSDTPPPQ